MNWKERFSEVKGEGSDGSRRRIRERGYDTSPDSHDDLLEDQMAALVPAWFLVLEGVKDDVHKVLGMAKERQEVARGFLRNSSHYMLDEFSGGGKGVFEKEASTLYPWKLAATLALTGRSVEEVLNPPPPEVKEDGKSPFEGIFLSPSFTSGELEAAMKEMDEEERQS